MRFKLFSSVLASGLLLGAGARPAAACGGFFCSQTPVLQTAERIVFEIEGDVVHAYIQLQYTGNDPSFAWIVPVPSVPEVEVGVGQGLFDALEAQTAPRFITPSGAPAAIADSGGFGAGCGDGGFFGGNNFAVGEPTLQGRYIPTPEVKVWSQAKVGPYEYVTLSAESSDDLDNWLRINNYRPDQRARPIVQEYLDDGMKLLALKLAPEAGASAVEPIKLTYRGTDGCALIPVKLTAIAAAPGLEIVTWVFGSSRAVPEGYGNATVDASMLSTPGDYVPALARAVDDQSNGRGFVTEIATPTAMLSGRGDAALERLLNRHVYVTRLRTFLDPIEMTEDPEFRLDPVGEDVSNEITLGFGGPGVSTGMVVGVLLIGLGLRRRRS